MASKKDKEIEIDFLLLEKYINSNDYEAILDYAYRHFHEEWNKIGIKRCSMPNNGGSLQLTSETGEKYTATIPNRASARSAGANYLMALCKVAGEDYNKLRSRSHKKYIGKNKKEISDAMDIHLDDIILLEVSLGSKSVIETMTHVRPRWMNLLEEDKLKYLNQILDIATESVLRGHSRSKTINEINNNLIDISISRTALQNQLDEYGIDKGDIYYCVEEDQGMIIDEKQDAVRIESTLSIDIPVEIEADYDNPEGTYVVSQNIKHTGDNKIMSEIEINYDK